MIDSLNNVIHNNVDYAIIIEEAQSDSMIDWLIDSLIELIWFIDQFIDSIEQVCIWLRLIIGWYELVESNDVKIGVNDGNISSSV